MKKAEKGLFVVLEEDERSKGVESEEQGQKKKKQQEIQCSKTENKQHDTVWREYACDIHLGLVTKCISVYMHACLG